MKIVAQLQYGGSDFIDGVGWEIKDDELRLLLCCREDMNMLAHYTKLSEHEWREIL